MAPAVVQASRPALEFGRVHADCRRHHPDADQLKTLQPDLAVAEGLHRRHRIGLALGPPDFFRFGIPGNADFLRDLVIVRREIGIADRPVEAAVVLAFDFKVVRQIAGKISKIVERRAADAPAGLVGVAIRVLPFEQERNAGGLHAPAPEIGADQIGHLPVRS